MDLPDKVQRITPHPDVNLPPSFRRSKERVKFPGPQQSHYVQMS